MFQTASMNTSFAQGAAHAAAASMETAGLAGAVAADQSFVAGVVAIADADYADRMARIWKGPEAFCKGVPMGDTKFNGVPLGMPGAGEAKVIFDPATASAIFEPAEVADTSISDPAAEGAPDALHTVDIIPVITGVVIGGVIVLGLYMNHVDQRIANLMRWTTDNIDRRRLNDFERARRGEDPFARTVSDIKVRMRRGDDGEVLLKGNFELWDDSVRALIEELVEGREERIPHGSSRRRRLMAIAEVRNLLRMESEQIFQSTWFPRVVEAVNWPIIIKRYDNVDELIRVARARLMTLEKAASANGNMNWPKASLEELRFIAPDRFSNVTIIEQ